MQDTHLEGRKLVVTAICFAVPLLVIFAALNAYQVSARTAEQFPDTYGVARAEQRFAPLMERLPANAQVAYITDLEQSNPAYPAALMATQYALAPRQLFIAGEGTRPEWAAGNFSRPVDFAAAGATHGYDVAADLGSGVILFRRRPSR
jgi:hypothetical protein